ncbi:MAG: hypothetical protein ACYC9Z_13075 [Casimicrobiaceae bacterium]
MESAFRHVRRTIGFAILASICTLGTAQATLLEISFTTAGAFSGTPPAGMSSSDIFANAIFDDSVGPNIVKLTMSVLSGVTNMPSGAYVNDWYFNLDPSVSGGVTLAFASGTEATTQASYSPNAYKADGTGGAFDIYFEFPTANPGQLGQGNSSVYTLTGTGITASSFNFNSISDPANANNGGAISAIHLQGYSSSVWIAGTGGGGVVPPASIPEPGVLGLVSVALLGLGLTAARRRPSQP